MLLIVYDVQNTVTQNYNFDTVHADEIILLMLTLRLLEIIKLNNILGVFIKFVQLVQRQTTFTGKIRKYLFYNNIEN